MIRIFFLFVGEGPSDAALIPHLEELCILCGAAEAAGVAPDLGSLPQKPSRTVRSKLRAALALEPSANLIFVHRDADSIDPEPRYREISRAESGFELKGRVVPVIPVQETEAWLLLDEGEIRRAADNPNGRIELDLPSASRIESIASPKEHLFRTLETASELSGRRRARFKKSLPRRRRLLLERLSPTGRVTQLPAWQRLKQTLTRTLQGT
jgi:hypothetical protein